MSKMLVSRLAASSVLLVLLSLTGASAQTNPATPATLPNGPPNLFFGADPPSPPHVRNADVIVFLHGLNGTAMNWWEGNDMYTLAYLAGYRTAFISMSADNTPDSNTFIQNGQTFASLLPVILQHFGVSRVYVVGHSKGGLDAEAAIVQTAPVAAAVRALFTISTPNTGSELADWLYDTPDGQFIGAFFGLLTPGVASLRLGNVADFRQQADPILRQLGIPIYTIDGDFYLNNAVTLVTGGILKRQVPSQFNDGFVTIERSRLPQSLASELGRVRTNHFDSDTGSVSFPKVNAQIQALEMNVPEFKRVEADGFGDSHNTWIWSMRWFQGKLYVGTGREPQCVSVMTADVQSGTNLYPLSALSGLCPAGDQLFQDLRGEIWQYTPETETWARVYQSPVIQVGADPLGNPAYTARDIGYRGMATFVEPSGEEVLYVGGVTSGSIYENLPPYAGQSYPPPRLLRTVDGTNWAAVPQTPGTFFGSIADPLPGSTRKARSIRSLVSYHGKLFATVGDFRGLGYVAVSETPWEGNDSWSQASAIPELMPVWNLAAFNDRLYLTTGDKDYSDLGFGLYKTDATGAPPFVWQPIISDGAFQTNPTLKAPNGLSFAEFDGKLYLGTNRPTELYRINPDDTWDLVVGEPRQTPVGYKAPLSGMGIGFGNWFNGHFWRMASHNDRLFVATWDSSSGFKFIPSIDLAYGFQYGFDFMRTDDGIRWTAISRQGLEDGNNTGGRSIESTPSGLFLGTARAAGGGQVYQCVNPGCDPVPSNPPAPAALTSVSELTAGRRVILDWDPAPQAVRYRVYRSTVTAFTLANEFPLGLPSPFVQMAIVAGQHFEENAPSEFQSIYFVRAEDADGNLSSPSNFVGAPSKADQQPPVIVPPQDVLVEIEPGSDPMIAVPLAEPFTSDDSGGVVNVTNDALPGYLYPLGTTVVNWSASDGVGHVATAQQSVTVRYSGPVDPDERRIPGARGIDLGDGLRKPRSRINHLPR